MEFWEIYDQFYARVRKFILALVKDEWAADDLIQETFLKIQNNLKDLKDPSKLSPWIFRIAYNLCQDHFRQLKISRKEERMGQEEREDLKEALIQKGPDIQKKNGTTPDGRMCSGTDKPFTRIPTNRPHLF
jgi:RNA polymerase sigma factor (sigma-70 family)